MSTALTLLVQLLPAFAGLAAPAPDSAGTAPAIARTATYPLVGPGGIDWTAARGQPPDTTRRPARATAFDYGSSYRSRLRLHRWLSFTMIPLFIGSYVTGEKLLNEPYAPPKWAKDLHPPFAIATGAVFAANTITGIWNLRASRRNPAGRVRRYVHSILFLAADAGFAYAGITLAKDAKARTDPNHFHRTVALASMSVSIVGWSVMLLTH